MFPLQHIPFDKRKIRPIPQSAAQQFRQFAIDLHRRHLAIRLQKFFRQRPRPRPNLDHQIIRRNFTRRGHKVQQVPIDHEILPQPVHRPAADRIK